MNFHEYFSNLSNQKSYLFKLVRIKKAWSHHPIKCELHFSCLLKILALSMLNHTGWPSENVQKNSIFQNLVFKTKYWIKQKLFVKKVFFTYGTIGDHSKKCLQVWRAVCLYVCFQRYIDLFLNMKTLIFMFEGPISNNKEKVNIAPSPPGTSLAKIILLNFFE